MFGYLLAMVNIWFYFISMGWIMWYVSFLMWVHVFGHVIFREWWRTMGTDSCGFTLFHVLHCSSRGTVWNVTFIFGPNIFFHPPRLPFALLAAGPPCSLFIFLCSSVHCRNRLGFGPRGDESNKKVQLANVISENLAPRLEHTWTYKSILIFFNVWTFWFVRIC